MAKCVFPTSAAADDDVSPITLVREALLSWVAHEIKSPLSAALVACQLGTRGLEHGEDREVLAKRFSVISRQLMRMGELVTSILDAAQVQEGRLALDVEEFELGEWVDTIAGFWKELHPDFRFPVRREQLVRVRGDKERLRQVLDNLLSNAVKYGGPSKMVRIEVSADAGEARISVTDDGRGIPRDDLPQVFDRFHRIAGQGGRGHGLGLYIAAALARLHGGELTVDSELERGSTFTLRLPRNA